MTYANAGHPPALLRIGGTDAIALSKTAPGGSVLGIFPEIEAPEITIDFPSSSELYLFTDGLYELMDAKGGRGSYDEFLAYLEAQTLRGKPTWEAMIHWLDRARDKRAIDDDVTLLRFATRGYDGTPSWLPLVV